jgi:anti-anti-sigma regulatory factor
MMGRRLKQSGGKFNICQAREVVKEVLETSGVGEIVDVFESLDEARGALVE